MRVLFIIPTQFIFEPLGIMLLKSICNENDHETKLHILSQGSAVPLVRAWRPDVIAYSAMTPGIEVIINEDSLIRQELRRIGHKCFRVMGGPHPTFNPSVLEELELDAICQGDGDRAFPELLKRLENGSAWSDIPNIAKNLNDTPTRELFDDLDSLPFADRTEYYQLSPQYSSLGLRSFWTSRGCPYDCSYCFNHAYNRMFSGCGKIVRRRSVERVLDEIEYVAKTFPPARFIRFSDDTFAHRADDWLEEFSEKYAKRIGIPFYCLMRSNTLVPDTARLLKAAGCYSIGMSLESGSEDTRNKILKRNLDNQAVQASFQTAHAHGIKVYTNAMLGIPGTTIKEDRQTLDYARKMRPEAASFTICCPFPGTEIWDYAKSKGLLDNKDDGPDSYMDLSILSGYTRKEKLAQGRMCYLAPLYTSCSSFLMPLVHALLTLNAPLKLCHILGMLYLQFSVFTRIMPHALPKGILPKLNFTLSWMKFLKPGKDKHNAETAMDAPGDMQLQETDDRLACACE